MAIGIVCTTSIMASPQPFSRQVSLSEKENELLEYTEMIEKAQNSQYVLKVLFICCSHGSNLTHCSDLESTESQQLLESKIRMKIDLRLVPITSLIFCKIFAPNFLITC